VFCSWELLIVPIMHCYLIMTTKVPTIDLWRREKMPNEKKKGMRDWSMNEINIQSFVRTT
jgi:hypothetical protein